MSSTVRNLRRRGSESLTSLAAQLIERAEDQFAAPEIVVNNVERCGNIEVLLLVMEKYYMRNGSMAALTIQCVSNGAMQTATVVGTGGGQGIFNIDWWANASFADKTCAYLEDMGFSEY